VGHAPKASFNDGLRPVVGNDLNGAKSSVAQTSSSGLEHFFQRHKDGRGLDGTTFPESCDFQVPFHPHKISAPGILLPMVCVVQEFWSRPSERVPGKVIDTA
jgi:hypothetical protein